MLPHVSSSTFIALRDRSWSVVDSVRSPSRQSRPMIVEDDDGGALPGEGSAVVVRRRRSAHIIASERILEMLRTMRRPISGGDGGRLLAGVADNRDDLDAVDLLKTVEMLFTEGAGAGQGYTHGIFLLSCCQPPGSSTMCPTAVLDAGT